jgi:hypothetical protein
MGNTVSPFPDCISFQHGLVDSCQHIPTSSAIVPGTVDAESLAIHKTHVDMVRFPSKEDGDYNSIVFQLQHMSDIAPSHIALNWMKHGCFLPGMSGHRQVMDPGNFELAAVNKY